jgi:hypothetical protein
METRQSRLGKLAVEPVLGMMAAAGIYETSQSPEKILR